MPLETKMDVIPTDPKPQPQKRELRGSVSRKPDAVINYCEASDCEGSGRRRRQKSRPKYHAVSDEKRLKLISLVMESGKKIRPVFLNFRCLKAYICQTAKRLGINYSTAKSICQVYRKEGRTEKKIVSRILKVKKSGRQQKKDSPTKKEKEAQESNSSNKGTETKSLCERPCHDDLEAESNRKKVKVTKETAVVQSRPAVRRTRQHAERPFTRVKEISPPHNVIQKSKLNAAFPHANDYCY